MILHSNVFGKGKPFIILHGFLGMSDNWKTLGRRFADSGFEMHLVDQRNHGRSFHSNDFNYEFLAQDLLSYCQHYQIEEVILLGHSMGGKTAMFFASQYPELVSKLIVADISPRYYPVHHDAILNGLQNLDFSEIKTRGQADEALAKFVPEVGVRMFLLKNLYWIEKGQLGLRINLEALQEHVSEVGESLPLQSTFEGDTLFMRGDRSEYIGNADEAIIKQHFPNSTLETITNSGHWLHAENPNAFFNTVMDFVS